MKKYAIIVAGGSGTRMGGSVPKQFQILHKLPILMHTIEKFYKYDDTISIILVLPQSQVGYWHSLCDEYKFIIPHEIAIGGATRFQSVSNGLKHIKNDGIVAVHDGVRPLVSLETLNRCFEEALKFGTAIPVISPSESVRIVDGNKSHAIDRSTVRLVQTPQVFQTDILLRSYNTGYCDKFTDDASVVENAGFKIHTTEGNRENIKLTTPDDMIFAEAILSKSDN